MEFSCIARRLFTTTLAVMTACVLGIGLAGCDSGPSDEELITSQLEEVLGTFKNPTKENLAPYLDGIDDSAFEDLAEYDLDLYEFLGHAFAKFDYTIDEVTVDGDSATASVTIKNASLLQAMTEASDWLMSDENVEAATEVYQTDGEKGLMKMIFNKTFELLDNADESSLSTTTTTVEFTKSDGEWDITPSSLQDLLSAMYGGLNSYV